MDRGERGGCKAQSKVEGINAEQGVLLEVVFIEKKPHDQGLIPLFPDIVESPFCRRS